MVHHVRAVDPAVPYWDLAPVPTPIPLGSSISVYSISDPHQAGDLTLSTSELLASEASDQGTSGEPLVVLPASICSRGLLHRDSSHR